jgi:subtilase family serine protease
MARGINYGGPPPGGGQRVLKQAWFSFGTLFCALAAAIPAPARQTLQGHLRPALAGRPVVDALPATQVLHLSLGLPLRDPAQLADLLRSLYDPASPDFRRFLSPPQFADRFGPSPADYQRLIDYARAQGFSVTRSFRSRALLDVSATAAVVGRALHVALNRYRRDDGSLCYSVDREPSLDLDLPLSHISGLDDLERPRPLMRAGPIVRAAARPQSGSGSGSTGYFQGSDFRHAYAADVTLQGQAQQVGLLEFDTYNPGDVTAYEAATGLTASASPRNVYLDGQDAATPPGAGADEVVLDIDLAQAMAPQATVVVYMGLNPDDVLAAIADDPAQPSQLSSSWFWQAISQNSATALAQCAVQGQTFFQASGDQGAYVGGMSIFPFSPGGTDYVNVASSIMDQADTTVVGGTRLSMTAGAAYVSETTWYRDLIGSPDNVGGGGGISPGLPLPLFQLGVANSANEASTQLRNLPDVSAVADDIVIDYTPPGGSRQAIGIAGTSAAAPLWAGFMALVNQQAALRNQSPVGWANAALYLVAGSPAYPACFHDIADNSMDGPYRAVAGYDLCTGWGSPKGMALINALLAPEASGYADSGEAGVGGGRLLTYPNPYHSGRAGWLKLSFPKASTASTFSVFDAGFRRVAQLQMDPDQGATGEGLYNGRDDSGRPLPPGTYYGVFKADGAPLRCVFTVLP